MIIETRLDAGDEVYTIDHKNIYIKNKCKICEGTGTLELKNGMVVNCVNCYSDGDTTDFTPVYFVSKKQLLIREIEFNSNGKKHTVIYKTNGYDDFSEKDLFKTKEEAQAKCDRLNKLENK